jgi:hypothetical protein
MSEFRNWYVRNQDAITWFIIGWLSLSCIDNLTNGSYFWAAFDAVIVFINLKLNDIRLQ